MSVRVGIVDSGVGPAQQGALVASVAIVAHGAAGVARLAAVDDPVGHGTAIAALVLAQEGMDRARFSQLELLDAQRTLLELRRERVVAAASYHRWVVEIEKLLGEPLRPESAQISKP